MVRPVNAAHPAQTFLAAFAAGERTLPLPAQLAVALDGMAHALRVDSVLRLLPGKRVVLRGCLDDRDVAVKLFVAGASSARHIARERLGFERVRAAGLPTPRLLGRCVTECGRFEGLAFEFIGDAVDLAQRWPAFDDAAKSAWLERLFDAMLQLHQLGGAYQEDIHLGNFLLREDQLYVLDLGSIVARGAPLPRAHCINNIGQLIAQLDIGERPLADVAVARYFKQCGWDGDPALREALRRAIDRAWRVRLRDYLGKAGRDCTLTRFEQSFRRVVAVRREWDGADFARFCADPDAYMAEGDLLKAGNTATVVKADIDGRPVVIKRYNIKNWRHAIGRGLRRTRARHSWRMAHLLEIMGIDSLKPVALLERRTGPLRGTAYFISTWIDAPDLLAVGAQRPLDDAELRALDALLRAMALARLSHGDFKANNLLVRQQRLAVIDLDSMRRHAQPARFQAAFRRDLRRLLRNWPADSAVTGQVAMVVDRVLEDMGFKDRGRD